MIPLIEKHKADIIKKAGELTDTARYTESTNIMREANRELGAAKAIEAIINLMQEEENGQGEIR